MTHPRAGVVLLTVALLAAAVQSNDFFLGSEGTAFNEPSPDDIKQAVDDGLIELAGDAAVYSLY